MEGCSDGETPQESKSSADKCMWSWATVLSVSMMSLVMMSVNTLIIFTMYYSTVLFFTREKKKEIPLSVLPKTQQFQSVYSLTPISDISGRYSDYGTDWPQTTTAQEGFHFQAIPGLMRFKKNIFWNSFSLDFSLIYKKKNNWHLHCLQKTIVFTRNKHPPTQNINSSALQHEQPD